MVNIFADIPRINPSLLNSIAGDTMEFANPVIGTIVPAPANFAILSYTLRPVRSAPKKIIVILTALEVSVLSRPIKRYMSENACPIVQISPPIKNANIIFFNVGDFGAKESENFL